MRAATFIAPVGDARPVSADPRDVLDHGETPRHRVAGPVFLQNGARLKLRGAPGDPLLIRLPRRLTRLGFGNPANDPEPLSDALRWIRGLAPHVRDLLQLRAIGLLDAGESADGSDVDRLWERRYPHRGLGLPKPLPRRRTPEAAPSTTTTGPFFHIREQLTIATKAMEKASATSCSMSAPFTTHRAAARLTRHGHLGLHVWPRWCGP